LALLQAVLMCRILQLTLLMVTDLRRVGLVELIDVSEVLTVSIIRSTW